MKISLATLLALLTVATFSPARAAPVAVPVPVFRRGPELVTKWDNEIQSAKPTVHVCDSDEKECGCSCEDCSCKEIDVSTLPIHLAYEIIKDIGHFHGAPKKYGPEDRELSTRENNWRTIGKRVAEATFRFKKTPALIIENEDNVSNLDERDAPKIVIPSLVMFHEDRIPFVKHVTDNDVVFESVPGKKPLIFEILDDDDDIDDNPIGGPASSSISPLYEKQVKLTVDDDAEQVTVDVDDPIGVPVSPIKSRPLAPIRSPPGTGAGRAPKYNTEPVENPDVVIVDENNDDIPSLMFVSEEVDDENPLEKLILNVPTHKSSKTTPIAAGRAPKPADPPSILGLEDFPITFSKSAIQFDSEVAPTLAGTRVTSVSPSFFEFGLMSDDGTFDTNPDLEIVDQVEVDDEIPPGNHILNALTQKISKIIPKWVCCKKGSAPTPGHPPGVAPTPAGTRVTSLVKIGQTF